MQKNLLMVHQWLVRIFMAGLLVQFYLAGTAVFGAESYQPHRMLGFALTILVILMLVLALVGRLGRKVVGMALLLVLLVIVQALLPALRGPAPWIAALHPANALVLMGVSVRLSRAGQAEAAG